MPIGPAQCHARAVSAISTMASPSGRGQPLTQRCGRGPIGVCRLFRWDSTSPSWQREESLKWSVQVGVVIARSG